MSFMIMAPPNSKLEFLVTRPSPISGQVLSGSFPIPSVGISLQRRCNTALPTKWWTVFSEQLHGLWEFNHCETDKEVHVH